MVVTCLCPGVLQGAGPHAVGQWKLVQKVTVEAGAGTEADCSSRSAPGHRAGTTSRWLPAPQHSGFLSKLTLVALQAVPSAHEGNLARVLSEF